MAEEYGTNIAEMANWAHMRTIPDWSGPLLSLALIAFLRSTNSVLYEPNFNALLSKPISGKDGSQDWDREVPSGG